MVVFIIMIVYYYHGCVLLSWLCICQRRRLFVEQYLKVYDGDEKTSNLQIVSTFKRFDNVKLEAPEEG